MIDFEQMGGRGGRDGRTKCLVILMAENWLYQTELETETESGSETEAEESNTRLALRGKARVTKDEVFQFVQSDDCRRQFLARLNKDNTNEGKK